MENVDLSSLFLIFGTKQTINKMGNKSRQRDASQYERNKTLFVLYTILGEEKIALICF